VSTPPRVVPPVSVTVTVTVASPERPAAGRSSRVAVGSGVRWTRVGGGRRSGLSERTARVIVCPTSLVGPGERPVSVTIAGGGAFEQVDVVDRVEGGRIVDGADREEQVGVDGGAFGVADFDRERGGAEAIGEGAEFEGATGAGAEPGDRGGIEEGGIADRRGEQEEGGGRFAVVDFEGDDRADRVFVEGESGGGG
jgi:hypothetical protein